MTAKFTIELFTEPEQDDVRGHFASGDADADRADEEAILAQLRAGNEWAWCVVGVRVSCGALSETAYLGCCSFECEEDFRTSGYFDDMVAECTNQLIEQARMVIAAAEGEAYVPKAWKLDTDTGTWTEEG